MKKLFLSLILIFTLCPLTYGADQWSKGILTDDELIPNAPGLIRVNNEAIDRILKDKQDGADVVYSSASQVIVSSGSVACSNAGDTVRRLRTNTSTTTVTWANIDTGAEAASTRYYIFSVADTDATTFTIKISTSSSAPSSTTYYKKIGSFYNNSSSNIDRTKVYTNAYGHAVNDSSGIPKITAIYNYGTSVSSYTSKVADLKFAYGKVSVGAATSVTISNLPFTSSSSFRCSVNHDGTTAVTEHCSAYPASASTATIYNGWNSTRSENWFCVGY